MSTIFGTKLSFIGITFTILFTLSQTPISESKPIKIRKSELSELVNIWKQACKCLDIMVKMTGADARSKGEGIPDLAMQELTNLMRVIAVFNVRMRESLDAFYDNCTESMEKSEQLREWRQNLNEAITKVDNQVATLCQNIGVKRITDTSVEALERKLDHVRDKCIGISLCLPNCKIGFERRYFEMLGRLIQGNDR